jgi:hypothetical protein
MLAGCPLQTLFQNQLTAPGSLFENAVSRFFRFATPLPPDIVEECQWQEPLFSEELAVQNWKQLLAFNVLCNLAGSHCGELAGKVRQFGRQPWNQSSQYFRALVALNHAFAKMPIPEAGPHLLESGAALIDLHEYCPWLALPYHPQHLELGIFLTMLALSTKRQDLEDIVLHMGQWQLNMLDYDAKPFPGLFVREKEGKLFEHLCLNYLFFRGVAVLKQETPFARAAESALACLQETFSPSQDRINPLWPLVETWLERYKIVSCGTAQLSEHIHDPSTALVGYRSPQQHVVCTLHGEHTGLGAMRLGQVKIVSYGPQYLPLEDCQGFGIEGNALSDRGIRRSLIEWRPHSFSLKGCTRLVDQPASSPLESSKFRGIWLDVAQEFKNPHLYLKTTFMALEGWDAVAFCFYLQADICQTQSQERLLPRTLDRYVGQAQTLTFKKQESELQIRCLSFKGSMQVIPLSGGCNFWGADFLVAYLLSPDQRQYQWHVGPPY